MIELMENVFAYLHNIAFVGTIVILVNIVLGIIVAVYEYLEYKDLKDNYWAWIKFGYACIGVYWVVAYSIIAFVPAHLVPELGLIIVRPGITMTLSVIAAGAYTRRHCGRR